MKGLVLPPRSCSPEMVCFVALLQAHVTGFLPAESPHLGRIHRVARQDLQLKMQQRRVIGRVRGSQHQRVQV